jgi:site-specific recombinase XerD
MEAGVEPNPCAELVTVDYAIQRFFGNLHTRGLSLATIKKNHVVIESQLAAFCQSRGFRYIAQLGINQLDDFVASWEESAISKVKKIERLKGFFRFCVSRKLISGVVGGRSNHPGNERRLAAGAGQDRTATLASGRARSKGLLRQNQPSQANEKAVALFIVNSLRKLLPTSVMTKTYRI